MAINKPWVEQYRPACIKDVIFTNAQMERDFKSFVKNGEIPNLLLYGPPGTGKTSVSKALCADLGIDKLDVLRINCSDEKIDALRDKVHNFAMSMPLNGRFKVVQLEEFDFIGINAFALLRSLIEDSAGTRFIATCNYINKIPPALRSRFQEYCFSAPNIEECMVKAASILEDRGITFELDDLESVVSAGYPDMRKIIQLVQQFSTSGSLVITKTDSASDWKLGLIDCLNASDFRAARKLVCESASNEELQDVYRFLYDNLHKCKKLKQQDEATVLIAQYQYQHAFVADGEINIAALFIELSQLMQ
jgi:DNA polymerase III delta prime subunit